MSVSLILIPTALAVAAAVGGAGIAGVAALGASAKDRSPAAGPSEGHVPRQVQVQTRMKDPALLGAALGDLGALRVSVGNDRITAELDGIRVEMTRDAEGIWAAHLEAADGRDIGADEAASLVTRLDAAYARRVQQEVAQRIRQRADNAGFDLVSETREDDDSVTMVLNVREYLS